jgi:hypothetical protein
MIEHAPVPILWGTRHRNLEYCTDVFKDHNQEAGWIQAGHCPDSLTIELHVVKEPYEWMKYITDYFPNLGNFSFCFSKFKPGTYFPMHIDRYGFYANHYNILDLSQLYRYVIFLEDSKPGHILQVGNQVLAGWSRGQCVGWQNDTEHLAANLGLEDRYTLQITGTIKNSK